MLHLYMYAARLLLVSVILPVGCCWMDDLIWQVQSGIDLETGAPLIQLEGHTDPVDVHLP